TPLRQNYFCEQAAKLVAGIPGFCQVPRTLLILPQHIGVGNEGYQLRHKAGRIMRIDVYAAALGLYFLPYPSTKVHHDKLARCEAVEVLVGRSCFEEIGRASCREGVWITMFLVAVEGRWD